MRKFALLLLLSLAAITNAQEKIQWMSIEEAYALTLTESTPKKIFTLTESTPKKIFIDVYTDWCGWCKRMDKATFQNPEVAAYMNEHYYNVKFDAEQKESIEMLGNTFEFVPQGSRGYHELAAALLNGKMSYPTVVFMNAKFEMLSPVPGYQEPTAFMNVAKYFGDNIYLETSWQDYSQQ